MTKKRILTLAPLLLVASLLCACGPNYSGHNNDFVMKATVKKIGNYSITVRHFQVESANGKAANWFSDKGHQIHNNYNTCGWNNRHVIGHVFDTAGNEIKLRDLQVGDSVEVYGRIRGNATSCGKTQVFKSRPVFDKLYLTKS